jgi:thioredoxin-related protein
MPVLRALIILTFVAVMSTASAAELVMFRRDGCPWCAAWDRDIGPIYRKTDIGRRVPLQMLNLHRDRTKIQLVRPVVYTPTFVLVDKGREIGRIEGYTGDQFFWELLDRLIENLPPGTASYLSHVPQYN